MPTVSNFRDRYGQILFLLGLFLSFTAITTGLFGVTLPAGSGTASFGLPTFHLGGVMPGLYTSPEFITLLISGLALALLLPVLSPLVASTLPLLATLPPVWFNYTSPAQQAPVPMEFSLLTILMIYAVNVLVSYFRETHEKQRIVAIFGQYVPPQIVTEISRHPEHVNLAGEARRLTVCFCDLKNFSSVAEQLNPRQLALLLNEYFTAMTEILYRHGATIDKYIGDSIMAFWGAPLPQADHARRSVLATFDMQKELLDLSDKFTTRSWPALSMGVGINTGIMNVGNMGSRYRIAYTVVGDAVNLASRLEALTRTYAVANIVSQATMEEVEGILFRELDLVQVKGKHNKTKIYEPVCLEAEADRAVHDMLQFHNEAMACYYESQWDKAEKLFAYLANRYPEDGFYPVMLETIRNRQ